MRVSLCKCYQDQSLLEGDTYTNKGETSELLKGTGDKGLGVSVHVDGARDTAIDTSNYRAIIKGEWAQLMPCVLIFQVAVLCLGIRKIN